MQETRVRFLGWEDPLEKEIATHSSWVFLSILQVSSVFLPGESQRQRSRQTTVHGVARVRHDLVTKPPPLLILKKAVLAILGLIIVEFLRKVGINFHLQASYFEKDNFIFNWRIIAFQCCVDFCHTSTWISHRYTYVPLLLNLPPTSHPIPAL